MNNNSVPHKSLIHFNLKERKKYVRSISVSVCVPRERTKNEGENKFSDRMPATSFT